MESLLIACSECRRQYEVGGMRPGESVRCRCGRVLRVPDGSPRREARMLHCSSCGGKIRAGILRCDYCGSETTREEKHLGPACPECFARLRVGARYCSACGIEIRPEAIRAVRADAKCPRCRGELIRREIAGPGGAPGGHFTECASCAGIWLDADSFERVVEKRDLSALGSLIPTARRSGPAAMEGSPDAENVRYLPCPSCGQFMNRKNFGGGSGVIIDWCRQHGYWFDTHELEKVAAFVQAGGLDKTRENEIRRQEEEIERLKTQKSKASGPVFPEKWGRASPASGVDFLFTLGDIFRLILRVLR